MIPCHGHADVVKRRCDLTLVSCGIDDPYYRMIRNRHYVENHGCIGQQLHYLIYKDGNGFMQEPIGIISGASSVYACAPRDAFFGINKDNRDERIQLIISNVVFRLELNERNLASRILALWRKTCAADWQRAYGVEPIGFETFIFGENRTGASYKADGWTETGLTAGKMQVKSTTGTVLNANATCKLIFCRWNTPSGRKPLSPRLTSATPT